MSSSITSTGPTSLNASFEADKDLHNPKKRRGKGRAKKLTEEEIRARKAEQKREGRARKKVQQQEAARDLAARLAGMECAGSEIAKDCRRDIAEDMTAREIATAQAAARAFLVSTQRRAA